MNLVKLFRENTRRLEMNLGSINRTDCCCCGVSDTDKGNERFNKIEHDMDQKFKTILDKIPEDKRSQVIEALQLYNEACEVCE